MVREEELSSSEAPWCWPAPSPLPLVHPTVNQSSNTATAVAVSRMRILRVITTPYCMAMASERLPNYLERRNPDVLCASTSNFLERRYSRT